MNYKVLYKNFSDLLNHNYKYIRNYNIILDVDFPLIFTFEANEKIYLAYVLELKRIRRLAELYVKETNYDEILELIEARKSLREVLSNNFSNALYISTYSKPKREIEIDVIGKFPNEDFYLSPILPNKTDWEEVITNIETSKSKLLNINYSKHNISSESITFSNTLSSNDVSLNYKKIFSGNYVVNTEDIKVKDTLTNELLNNKQFIIKEIQSHLLKVYEPSEVHQSIIFNTGTIKKYFS